MSPSHPSHYDRVSIATLEPPDRNETPVANHGDSKSAARKPSLRDSKISNDDDEHERLQKEALYIYRIRELTAERHDLVSKIKDLENSGKEYEKRLARTELERDGLRASIAARERALRQEGVKFEDVETLEDLKARHVRALERASIAEKRTQAVEEEILQLRESFQGKKHPDAIMALANLSLTYYYSGRKAEAIEHRRLLSRRSTGFPSRRSHDK